MFTKPSLITLKSMLQWKRYLLILALVVPLTSQGQLPDALKQQLTFDAMLPNNTATHVAKEGTHNWSDPNAWERPSATSSTSAVPGFGAIVVIPKNSTITYDMNSLEHIFVIKNQGKMIFKANRASDQLKLVVDTYINTIDSEFDMTARDGQIEVVLKAFDIKKGANTLTWNNIAKGHYTDGKKIKAHTIQGEPKVNFANDKAGVLGRYEWDPRQVSLSLMSAGKVRIIGKDKLDFSECAANMLKNATTIQLKETPQGWKAGDKIVISKTAEGGSEVFTIANISGNTIAIQEKARFDHIGVELTNHQNQKRNYYPYVGNLTRNIIIRSYHTDIVNDITQRGHVMWMFNDQFNIRHASFKDLGRTNKSDLLDDYKYEIIKDGNRFIIDETTLNNTGMPNAAPNEIQNQRGRYGFHFHKTLTKSKKQVFAIGNVVWGSPGWGMVHHDTNADFTDNVVFGVKGGAMVAESGSELGIWQHNLVVGSRVPDAPSRVKIESPLRRVAREILDDDFRGNAGFALQGRAVRMLDNVAAGVGVAYHYQGTGERMGIADKVATQEVVDALGFDAFPLEEKIERTAIPLIQFKGNIAATCSDGFKSQGRTRDSYNRVLSIVEDHIAWNCKRFSIYISSNFGYLLRNSVFHGLPGAEATGILTQNDNDNINFANIAFDGFTFRTLNVSTNEAQTNTGNHPDAELVFSNVKWLNSAAKPYSKSFGQAKVVKNFTPGNISFAHNDALIDLVIDPSQNDFEVTIAGDVTDNAGTHVFAQYTPTSNKGVNNRRVYNFESIQKLNAYLNKTGQCIKSEAGKRFFEFTEHISDRITGETQGIKFSIEVKGSGGKSCSNNTRVSQQVSEEATTFLKIIPNPVSDGTLRITQKGHKTLTIINPVQLKILKTIEITHHQMSIDVSDLPAGVYLLKSDTDSIRFVIKK